MKRINTGNNSQFLKSLWDVRTNREKKLIIFAIILLTALIVWNWILDPSIDQNLRLKHDLPILQSQLRDIEILSNFLEKTDNKLTTLNTKKNIIARSLSEYGIIPNKLDETGDTVQLNLNGIPLHTVINWIVGVEYHENFFVFETNMSRNLETEEIQAIIKIKFK